MTDITSKESILARIRAASANAPEPAPPPVDYRQRDLRDPAMLQAEFADRLIDYKAHVIHTDHTDLPQAIAATCQQYSIQRLVLPADLPLEWLPADVTPLRDTPFPHVPLSFTDLDSSDAVITGCALAIAQTGTIILDAGPLQGRRALSLIPDQHLCVVRASQIVGLVPEAITSLNARAEQPITFISGPSATSDIELSRVEGVHGPRTLHVFIVTDL